MHDDSTVRVPLLARDGSLHGHILVDAADASWVGQWKWSFSNGYAVRPARSAGMVGNFYLHRELLNLGRDDKVEVDHINRDRLDNRRSNLRVVTRAENGQNLSARGAYRGVFYDPRYTHPWRATVRVAGKRIYLGSFASEQDAADAAREARARLMPYSVD